MPTPAHYSGSGPRITVNAFVRDPLMIRARMIDLFDQQFVMNQLLRNAGNADAGVISYSESTPLFTDDDASVIAEGGEIPLTTGQDGIPKAAYTIKTGMGIEITQGTRDRNKVDRLNQRKAEGVKTDVGECERARVDRL